MLGAPFAITYGDEKLNYISIHEALIILQIFLDIILVFLYFIFGSSGCIFLHGSSAEGVPFDNKNQVMSYCFSEIWLGLHQQLFKVQGDDLF